MLIFCAIVLLQVTEYIFVIDNANDEIDIDTHDDGESAVVIASAASSSD